MEYALNDMLFLRAGLGINTQPDLQDTTADQSAPLETTEILRQVLSNRNERGPSAGLGVKVPVGDMNISVDYSFEWHWFLNPVHRASLGLSF